MFAVPIAYSFTRFDLRTTDRVTLADGLVLRAKSVDEKGQYFGLEDDFEFTRFVSHADLYAGLISGEIRIEEDYYSLEKTMFRETWGDTLPVDLTPKQLELPRHKQALIARYENLIATTSVNITGKMLAQLLRKWNEEINEENRKSEREALALANPQGKKSKQRSDRKSRTTEFVAPTVETFNGYYKRYVTFGRNLVALARKPTKAGCTRNRMNYDSETLALATMWADKYYARDKGDKKTLFTEYKADLALKRRDGQVSITCEEIKYDRFDQLIMAGASYDRVLAREGPAKARKWFRPLREGNDITRPGELVQFDDKLWDISLWLRLFKLYDSLTPRMKAIADTTRVWITVGVDVATGWIPALKMGLQGSTQSIIDAIEMAVSDKTQLAQLCGARLPWFQIPIIAIMSDNGVNYADARTKDAVSSVGINFERTPAEQPWLRGHCERTLRLLSELSVHAQAGKTFANTVEKGDDDPSKSAALLVEEFYALLVRMICDYHHLRISGPRRQAAFNAVATYLQETKDGARKLVDLHRRRHVFGVAMKRVIHPDGILLWGIRFNSDELQMLRQQIGNKKVVIKSHEEDIRWISAQLPDGQWISVPARERFDEQIRRSEWIKAREDVIADAEKKQEPYLEHMYEALRHRRHVGDSAILAANLTMHKPSHRDIARHQKIMFENVEFQTRGPLPALPALMSNADDLLANSFAAIKAENSDLLRQVKPKNPSKKTASAGKKTAQPKAKSRRDIDDYDAY